MRLLSSVWPASPGLKSKTSVFTAAMSLSCNILPHFTYEKSFSVWGARGSTTSTPRCATSNIHSSRGSDTRIATANSIGHSLRSSFSRAAERALPTPFNRWSVQSCRLLHAISCHYTVPSSVSCSCAFSSAAFFCAPSACGIKYPLSPLCLHLLAKGFSTSDSLEVIRAKTRLAPNCGGPGSQPRALRQTCAAARFDRVGRFANATFSVNSTIPRIPDSTLRKIFQSALTVDTAKDGRRTGEASRGAVGVLSTGRVPAAARATLAPLFRALLRSGVLEVQSAGKVGLQNVDESQRAHPRTQGQQVQVELGKLAFSEAQDQDSGGLTGANSRRLKQKISFTFLIEVYNQANLYACWGGGAQVVKSAGVKGLRPGTNLRGGIVDASPKPMSYEEFRAFVEVGEL